MEVNISHGKKLQELVPIQYQTTPWWVNGRGHNDIIINKEVEFFRYFLYY